MIVQTAIVMGNASFHKRADLNHIAQSYGLRIIWLPTYSPDKNRIEKYWANMKNWLRIHSKSYATIHDALSAYFKSD